MQNKMLSQTMFSLSVVAVLVSAAVSVFAMNLWLAGTQWMIVAVVLAVWAVYLKE